MHVRYTDYLLSGFKGDCRISVIVDGWKEAEKLFQAENNNSQQNAIETSNNIVNEISKLLGGEDSLHSSSDTKSRRNEKSNCDGEIQNEILNVKEENHTNLFLFSDDDEEKSKQQMEIDNLMKDIDSLTDKNGKNTESQSKSPNLNLNYNYETGKATLKPGTDLDENGQKILSLASQKLQNNSNSTENSTFSDLFNKPSLLYVNSESYTNRFGNTDFAQGITDLTQTQPTINNLSHSTQNNSSSSPKLHIPHVTQKIDGKLHCHWEGCSFSTPRRTALKRHIQCIHMDVRNYSAFTLMK